MTERFRLACGCEIIRHEGIAATERVYCAQHGEAETKSLTDERLEEMERFALALDRSDMRALIAEVRALRRVAEAAERDVTDAKAQCGYYADVHRCYGPQYKRHCTDCPYEVVRETDMALADMALAEWRRVRGESE